MAEHLLCPGCRKEPFILEAETHAYTLLECSECSFQAQESDWNRRTPSPATAAMLEWIRTSNRELSFGPPTDLANAFLAEWPDSTNSSAPVARWKCCVCGKPVRIGDSLQPYHLDGPTNHDAELSNADGKVSPTG